MKKSILSGIFVLMAGSLLAADSTPKDDVKAAAKALADNYSWRTTTAAPTGGGGGNARFRPGPTDGKTAGGTTWLEMTRGTNVTDAVLTGGGKGAAKMQDGWQSLADLAADDGGGGFNPRMFMARMLQNFKAPATQAGELADGTKALAKADDAIAGDLTEDGAKAQLTFGPPGGDGPTISNAKGSVKFWVRDGKLAKYELHVSGSIDFNGNNRDVDRTTTVELKDIGTTKVEVPEDAKSKLK
ncbi:MAG TPA: hypothetical protein VK815_17045 [Candidatus Acidoferrales bacterium]|jgi:hypothetical protein|nr:hypothetical protein [Candidatus Acidoferrales bacterium]